MYKNKIIKLKHLKAFENMNNPLTTINDFLESFPDYNIDYVENNANDFVHPDIEDFGEYIIVDDIIKIEKEYILMDENEKEIFVYTDSNDNINGYAFNID